VKAEGRFNALVLIFAFAAAPYLSSRSTALDLFPHLRSAADLLMLPKVGGSQQRLLPFLPFPFLPN
jgi:hypothetical protein